MRELSYAEFSGRIGDTFEVGAGDVTVALKLAAASEFPSSLSERSGFRLEWEGPRQPVLPQAIYMLTSGGESWEIFIVPTSTPSPGIRYEAIFN